ncbi:MAG: gliding motility-associated C-terminal domain-containing protein [Cytophagaceae bacterium]
MDQNYEQYEEIDRYLNKELSEAELLRFHEKLSGDAGFKELVEAQKTANEIIIYQEMSRLKARVKNDLNNGNNDKPWGKIFVFSALFVSAGLYTYMNYPKSEPVRITKPVTPSATSQNGQPSVKSISNPVAMEPFKSTGKAVRQDSLEKEVIREEAMREGVFMLNCEGDDPVTVPPNQEQPGKETTLTLDQPSKVNCETVNLTAQVRVDYGTGDAAEATVLIDKSSVAGGTAPYSFALDHTVFGKENRFTVMKDGIYSVRIKDQNNCISELKKKVVVRIPSKEIDAAFVPSQGERWKFPVKENAGAEISIFSKTGIPVYTATISNGNPQEWDGRNNNGAELENGNYYFVIKYSSGEVVKGHISIVQ